MNLQDNLILENILVCVFFVLTDLVTDQFCRPVKWVIFKQKEIASVYENRFLFQ